VIDNMNLTRFTDYSLRTLIFVGLHDERLSSIQEVSDAFRISKNHLLKVVNALGQAGFLTTVRGRSGGLSLAKPADTIVVGDVVRAMEPGFDLLECFDPKRDECVITTHCRLKGILHRAMNGFLAELDSHTLADLLHSRDRLLAIVDPHTAKSRPVNSGTERARASRTRRRGSRADSRP
jgi:Rrf2 family nitric oxide-sensitive transcriptional repressor